ncbi:MAG: hypothetical protein LH467_01905 [Gemmatimonadaceae bacterium]|nr:hypothetical protein [Gemmatimonadaceae bacterium]
MIGLLLAAQLGIVARGPDTAVVCQPFELTVAVRAVGAATARVDLAPSADVQVLSVALTSRAERQPSGAVVTLTEGRFVVATGASGRVVLPQFIAEAGPAAARSAPLVVDVRPPMTAPALVLVRATLDAGDGRRADTLFVGQQVDYVVDVQINDAARQRLRHNPTFFPPDMPATLAYDLAPPAPLVRDARRCFETLSYRRALFPLFPGAAVIPPATLTYALPLSTSFFAREENFELRTDSARFVAVEPPLAGRPAGYAGAVGRLAAAARFGMASSRMGDPVTFTLRLTGLGNVKLLPRPPVAVEWATVALGGERVTIDTTAPRVSGTKEFDWLLTPRRAGRLQAPVIRYPFFDPALGRYEVALADASTIDVAPATLATADTAVGARYSIRRALRDEAPAPLLSRAWFWALLLGAPVPASLRRVVMRRRRAASGLTASRRLRTYASASRPPSPRELRRTYLDALSERVPAAGRDATVRAPLARLLRRAGVTERTAITASDLLDRLDQAAFSAAGVLDPALAAQALASVQAVDAEAVRPSASARRIVLPAVAILLTMSAVAAIAAGVPAAVRRGFDDGVQAYERGEYAVAYRAFSRAAARAPRAADAWANAGTAAWARGDTAHAVRGWQRALRLDPYDVESRERLDLVHESLIGTPAYVAPLSGTAGALAGLALWCGAWLALAIQAARRTPHVRAVAGGTLVIALVLLVGAVELEDRAAVRGLGVVRHARPLLIAPSADRPATFDAATGEVGTLGAREGSWVWIVLDGTRAGWVPAGAVLSLDGNGVD